MEGVGDRAFRKSMAIVGGFDHACTEFIRVPSNAHVESLAKVYHPDDTAPIPQAAQLMGGDPELMADMAIVVERRGAPRIDLNCGCPSNTVTGRGAGSSLLKDPEHLHKVASALVKAVKVPVTAKLRSGFNDTGLFKENLLAAEASGIRFLTLHPRTKVDGYKPPAKWELIAEAKNILKIPVVGNGDILTLEHALKMLSSTRCDALMIGRGAVINPLIFHEIKAHFAMQTLPDRFDKVEAFLNSFILNLPETMLERGKINKMKQIFCFLFQRNDALKDKKLAMLTTPYANASSMLKMHLPVLKEHWT